MRHTADPKSFLGSLCKEVAAMKPGERLTVSRFELRSEIPSFYHNGAEFTPADRVLGNIIGAAYTHDYTVNPTNGDVTFRRHEDTGERRYVDPDHRERMANKVRVAK
jgi:hypothetical protein